SRDDALDSRDELTVSIPRCRPCRDADGLRGDATSRYAGRRLSRVLPAVGGDPNRSYRALRLRGGKPGHPEHGGVAGGRAVAEGDALAVGDRHVVRRARLRARHELDPRKAADPGAPDPVLPAAERPAADGD